MMDFQHFITQLEITITNYLPGEESQQKMRVNYDQSIDCLLYTSPSPRDLSTSRMPSSA